MNDLMHASTFFLIFAAALVLYGALIVGTGDVGLIPHRAAHSIRNPSDVRRVGRIVIIVGIVIGMLSLLLRIVISR